MAATIAYMTEWGWDVQDLLHWTRPETDLLLANEVHMTEQWWKLEHLFYHEAQQQRTHRFARRPNHQHLLTGLDWHTFRQLKGKLYKHGFREHSISKMLPEPSHVPFVRFQLHRSMCYGCASGTETKITNQGLTAQQLEERLAETCMQHQADQACPNRRHHSQPRSSPSPNHPKSPPGSSQHGPGT